MDEFKEKLWHFVEEFVKTSVVKTDRKKILLARDDFEQIIFDSEFLMYFI